MDGDPRLGAVLQGRYRVLERIGDGAMAVVYRAERLELGRPVAVKFLDGSLAREPQGIRRFEIEARAMSRLSHPHCVSVLDFGLDASPYLVMDLVQGPTLRSLLDGPMPAVRAIRIARQILAALAHAHGNGIVHRDIKPENILLEEVIGLGDHVRVVDFGLAKLMNERQGLTIGIALGTPNYMAPEQVGDGPIDERVDLYAVGIVLFEMLTGKKPFDAPDPADVLIAQQRQAAPGLRAFAPAVAASPALEDLLATALAKAPQDRFPSALAMADALAALPDAADAPPADPDRTVAERTRLFVEPAPAPPARRWARTRAGRAALALAGVIPIALGAALLARERDPSLNVRTEASPAPPESPASAKPAAIAPDEVDALLARGDREGAIKHLVARRRQAPRDAASAALLARLYFEKSWWGPAIGAFNAAVRHGPEHKHDAVLLDHTISALGQDRWVDEAEDLLRACGPEGRARVRQAAREHPSPLVRKRAGDLARNWNCRGFFCP